MLKQLDSRNKFAVLRNFSTTRKPLIKFLGKRSLLTTESKSISPGSIALPISSTKVPKIGNGVDFWTLQGKGLFGRPALSTAEIEGFLSQIISLFFVVFLILFSLAIADGGASKIW